MADPVALVYEDGHEHQRSVLIISCRDRPQCGWLSFLL